MPTMNAAVVTSFGEPPHYQRFGLPAAAGPEQILVDVLAVGLHPRVRSGARGAHYTSSGTLPMIPGIDGVGRRDDGTLIYFAADDDVIGTMSERTVVDVRRAVELPAEATAAALAEAAADIEIVIDYLWGEPAQRAMMALLQARADRSRPLDWIQIGAVAGATIELPSVALRSANLRLQGSGQGSVSPAGYVAELPSLVAEIAAGSIAVKPRPVPLAQVERVWLEPEAAGERVVLVP